MKPLVSVIVPVYGNRNIRKCLKSIQCQDYTNFECIVVIDGSKDSSYCKYCHNVEALDSRFFIASYQNNRGASYARGVGISSTHGEIVAFLDSDDIWSPIYLSTIVKVHKENPRLPIVGTEITYNEEETTFLSNTSWQYISIRSLCLKHRFSTPATSIKRSMIVHNFSPSLHYAEDLFFFLINAINSRKPIVFINRPLVLISREQGSTGGLSADRVKMYSSTIRVYFNISKHYIHTSPIACLILIVRSFYALFRIVQFSLSPFR